MGDKPKGDDPRRLEDLRRENFTEDWRYTQIQQRRAIEIDKLRSAEAIAVRHGVSGSVSGSRGQPNSPKQYERYRFIEGDAEHVAKRLDDFARRVEHCDFATADAFENFKDHTLEAIDRYLPPSEDKEAIYAEVLELRYPGGRHALGPILDPNAEVRLATLYRLRTLAERVKM